MIECRLELGFVSMRPYSGFKQEINTASVPKAQVLSNFLTITLPTCLTLSADLNCNVFLSHWLNICDL